MTSIPSLVETIECKQLRSSYLKNKTFFLNFFFVFRFESALNFQHFQKKVTLIDYVFPKLPTTKHMLRSMSKRSRFRGPFDRPHGKRSETLIQS